MYDVHLIISLCVDQVLPAVNNAFPQKTQVVCIQVRFVRLYPYPVSVLDYADFFSKTVTTQSNCDETRWRKCQD